MSQVTWGAMERRCPACSPPGTATPPRSPSTATPPPPSGWPATPPTAPAVRSLEREIGRLTVANPLTGGTDQVGRYLADPVEVRHHRAAAHRPRRPARRTHRPDLGGTARLRRPPAEPVGLAGHGPGL